MVKRFFLLKINMNTQQLISKAMSELGKRSAIKNKHKRDYRAMGRASVEARRRIKLAKNGENEK